MSNTDPKVDKQKNYKYSYDKNGNMIYVNTEEIKLNGQTVEKAQEKKMLWDEENRLEAIDINGYVSNYTYDAGGERVTKLSGGGQGIFVNSVFSGGKTSTSDFTLYVNPYLVAQNGGRYTKHIYIGSQRIVSKLGDFDSYGADPRRVEKAGESFSGVKVNYEAKYKKALEVVKANYDTFEVPYYGLDNNDYVNGLGFCCNPSGETGSSGSATGKMTAKNDNAELQQFYYHPDHLGSSSYISNLDGEVVQHIEYVPFGEVFLEEKNAKWNTPYLFTSKELDRETGLYYYGARYQDPKLGIFISVDPLAEKHPEYSSYVYTANNPVKFIDPDGKDWLINYVDKQGKQQEFVFNGGATVLPDNQFVRDFVNAYNYNVGNGGGQALQSIAENHNLLIDVQETKFQSTTQQSSSMPNSGNYNVLEWNPSMGLETTSGNILSPATILDHEAGHILEYALKGKIKYNILVDAVDAKYDTKEEGRVIEGTEQRTARGNGEVKYPQVTRNNHKGLPVMTKSPTSNKIDRTKTYKFLRTMNATGTFSDGFGAEDTEKYKP